VDCERHLVTRRRTRSVRRNTGGCVELRTQIRNYVFSTNGWTNRTGFRPGGFLLPSPRCVIPEIPVWAAVIPLFQTLDLEHFAAARRSSQRVVNFRVAVRRAAML